MRNLTFSSSYPDPLAPAENHAVRALAESYNDFGQTIFGSLAKQPGNIVYSPYSAGVGFAMAMSGARGATQAEFLDSHAPSRSAERHRGLGRRLGALLANFSERRDREARGMGERPLAELAIANLIALTSPDGQFARRARIPRIASKSDTTRKFSRTPRTRQSTPGPPSARGAKSRTSRLGSVRRRASSCSTPSIQRPLGAPLP